MKKRQFLRKISVFYKYLISYMSLVVLGCSLLGFVLLNHSVHSINKEMEAVNQYKLSLITSDLDAQAETMKEIALQISVTLYYKPFYIAENPYYEGDLLLDFAKYKGASPIVEEYFLFYRDEDRLFKSDAKNAIAVYFRDVLALDNWQQYQPLIQSTGEEALLTASSKGKPVYLFVYPVRTTYKNDPSGDAFLCFVTSAQTLGQRAVNIAGELPGSLQIQYRGSSPIDLCGTAAQSAGDSVTLRSESVSTLFQAILTYDNAAGVFEGISQFQRISLLLIALFILVLLGFSAVLAYGNYRPIKKLESIEKKFVQAEDTAAVSRNEIDHIESMFRSIVEMSAQNRMIAENQMVILRRQMINNMMNEGFREEFSDMTDKLGITLPGPYYCVLSVDVGSQVADQQAFFSSVDTLAADRFRLYAGSRRPGGSCAVLASLSDADVRPAATALLKAFWRAHISVIMGAGSVFSDPEAIPAAFLESQIALKMDREDDTPVVYYDEISDHESLTWYDNDAMLHLIKAMHLGCEKDANDCLEAILDRLEHQAVSLQRHICSNILISIIKAAHDQKINVDPHKVVSGIVMRRLSDFRQNASAIIHDACAAVNANRKDKSQEKTEQVLEYINTHFDDFEMGLKHLSDHFDITPTTLSRTVKQYTGETFRNYVTLLRIDRAKELLMTDSELSIAMVAKAIGYESISHFIRAFKKITGITPALYRKVNSEGA